MDARHMGYIISGLLLVLYYFYSIFSEQHKGSIKAKFLSLPFKKVIII
jgi:hypothetical protein